MGVRYRFGEFTLDVAAHELLRGSERVPLPARVFECLTCLIAHRDRAVGRDELLMAVFSRTDVSDAQLAQIVLRARRAIGDDGQEQRAIRTVPRFGFRWVAVTAVADGSAADPSSDPGDISRRVATDSVAQVAGSVHATQPARIPADGEDAPSTSTDGAAGWQARGDASVESTPHATLAHTANVPVAPARRGRPGLAAVAITLAIALAAVLATTWWARRPDPAATTARHDVAASRAVAVLPVEVGDAVDVSWARLGLMDFVADRLRRSGLPVASSETVIGVLRAQAGAADPARVHAALRTPWVVDARVRRDGRGWSVLLVARHRDGTAQRGEGRADALLDAARVASDRLAVALGGRVAADPAQLPGLGERLQRARVAMLANELDSARRILLDAPELQRRQPRLQYQLARVDFRAGDFARGLATLDAVLASPDVAEDRVFHAQVRNARGAMLLRLDRLPAARGDYDDAIALASDGHHPTELGVAYSGRGVAHAMQHDYDRAIADLSQARVHFDSAGDALAMARVDGNLGTLEADRGRPAYGLPYLTQAIDVLATMGAVNELVTVRNVRTAAYLQLLQTREAVAESDRAWALYPRLSDPAQRADVLLARADVMLATGRLREAGRLLALPAAAKGLASEHGRREWLAVRLAQADGAPAQAVKLADAALAGWPDDGDARTRAWLESARERSALDAELAVNQSALPGESDSVAAQLVQATRLRARGDRAGADAADAAAFALAERHGLPSEMAAAAAPRVASLLDRGQTTEAAALLARLLPLAAQDYDLALLQLRVARAGGDRDRWQAAWRRASSLAGERAIPTALVPPAS